jgi:hypothetical protein
MLPILRTTQILRDTCGVTLSPGAVVRMIRTAAGNLIPTVAHLETLRKQGVDLLHALVHSFQGETPQPTMG